MQRRSLLKLGFISAAVLAVTGGAIALLKPGLQNGKLSDASRDVFASVGRAVLAGTLPRESGASQIAVGRLLDRIDALTASLAPHAQQELSQLLGLLATALGRLAVAGLNTGWRDASVVDVQAALQSMRFSGLELRQQAYSALHDISSAAYFADPSTWTVLGYPGPISI